MNILVIEDAASIRAMLVRFLRRTFDDVFIVAVASGSDAIASICHHMLDRPFDLVISDYNLDGPQTGGDVLEWIRHHASYLEERFLFLSSDEAAKAMHPHFLEKPCELSALRTTIQAILRKGAIS